MHRRHIVIYLILALLWGSSFVLIREVVRVFGWVGSVSLRAFIASAVLFIIARIRGRKLRFGRIRDLGIIGLTTVALQLAGLGIATPRIGTAMAAILVGAIPLYTMVIGQLWGIEHITALGKIGVITGLVGMVLLVGFPAAEIDGNFVLGCCSMLIGTIAAAIGSNYSHKFLNDVPAFEQTMGGFFFGGVISLPLFLIAPIPTTPHLADYVMLISLAAFFSALTYVLYFTLVAEVGPTIAISSEFMVTLVAVFIGTVFLGESLNVLQYLGAFVIIGSCALVLGLVPKRIK